MELVLVRHAQPAWVVDGIGYNNPDLSRLGSAQAEAVGEALADVPFDEFWVSPAVRSQRTAAAIVAHHDVPVVTHDWALEIQLPDAWDEAPADQIREHFATLGNRDRGGWWEGTAPQGGESFRDFHARVTAGLEAQLAERGIKDAGEPDLWHVPEDDDQRIGVVTHAGTNSVVVGHLLGVSPQPWEWSASRRPTPRSASSSPARSPTPTCCGCAGSPRPLTSPPPGSTSPTESTASGLPGGSGLPRGSAGSAVT